MSPLDQLVHRYLDDRQALAEDEIDALVAGLRADPARAIELREQLMLDDLVSQKLAGDRLNFLAQVGQRIADFERGEEEIDSHVVELRAMAEGEILAPPPQTRGWLKYAAALAITLLLLVAVSSLLWAPRRSLPVAKVLSSSGDVVLRQPSGESALAAGASVLTGQEIITPAGGHATLQYADNTNVEIHGGSQVKLSGEGPGEQKYVFIQHGHVVADVTPQPDGAPMKFVTPHAEAIVLGTRLSLRVSSHDTILDVIDGSVVLNRTEGESISVGSQESGLATSDRLQLRELRWPSTRDGLIYVYEPFGMTSLARNPETGNLRDTPLESVGGAALNEFTGSLELSGGHFISADAGTDLFKILRATDEFSVEVVMTPQAVTNDSQQTILCFGDPQSGTNFMLVQSGNCILVGTNNTLDSILFSELKPNERSHLVIAFQHGKLTRHAKRLDLPYDMPGPISWTEGPLVLGADASGRNAWNGNIEGLAIYSRALTAEEILRHRDDHRILSGGGK